MSSVWVRRTPRVLLAEDDARLCQAIADGLAGRDMDVITAHDGEETVRKLRAALPDALVMDMVMPRLDGLAVLCALPGLRLERRPRIIALSPFRDPDISRRAKQLGAARVLPKPVELNRLAAALNEDILPETDPEMRKRIGQLLLEAGIVPGTKGTMYLSEAVALTARDYACTEHMREAIYVPIANSHSTRPENVERLIRHVIERACMYAPLNVLHSLFGATLRSDTGKPTNAEFIAIIAENIRNKP